MEAATDKYAAELAAMGVDLLGLIKGGTRFIHNEARAKGGGGVGWVDGGR
jgi:hypothetical protein